MGNMYWYETDLGPIGITEEGEALTHLYFRGEGGSRHEVRETPLLRTAARQLEEYLAGRRQVFDLPLAPAGTAFQREVWAALQAIPYGETRSYKEIAAAIGRPRAVRAVGQANNRNPLAIFIPCHRVVGADGGLVGYAGGLEIKKRLLAIERAGCR